MISGDSFPSDWFTKLNDKTNSFNLLGEGKRFYQRKPGSGKSEKLSANYLIQEVPTGTNFWHFRHSTDRTDGLCPACCAGVVAAAAICYIRGTWKAARHQRKTTDLCRSFRCIACGNLAPIVAESIGS